MVKTLKQYNIQPSKSLFVCDGCFQPTENTSKGIIKTRMYDPVRRYDNSGLPMQHHSSLCLCPKCFSRISTEMNNIKINL